MHKRIAKLKWVVVLLLLAGLGYAQADAVQIQYVKLAKNGPGWRFSVTLKHADSGWKHYADAWRIVDKKGKQLGKRVLYHPHVDEQPFTRSLGAVRIPDKTRVIYVEAHDKVHGWSKDKVKIDLKVKKGSRYLIE